MTKKINSKKLNNVSGGAAYGKFTDTQTMSYYCSTCKKTYDCSEVEFADGYVKCPTCGEILDQHNCKAMK